LWLLSLRLLQLLLADSMDQGADRVGRLGTILNPVIHTLQIQAQTNRLHRGVVVPDDLQKFPTAGTGLFRYYDPIVGILLGSMTTQTYP
jgi:hypothetical protein